MSLTDALKKRRKWAVCILMAYWSRGLIEAIHYGVDVGILGDAISTYGFATALLPLIILSADAVRLPGTL